MPNKAKTVNQSPQIPKIIIITAKFLQAISPKLVTLFAAKLFTTPIKHKIPKRELKMVTDSIQTTLFIPAIKKTINIYNYGHGKKRVLLVHGWSGRGTQLVKIADALLELGYSTISFDAPAHGKSKGSSTIMTEFIVSIIEIEKQLGVEVTSSRSQSRWGQRAPPPESGHLHGQAEAQRYCHYPKS